MKTFEKIVDDEIRALVGGTSRKGAANLAGCSPDHLDDLDKQGLGPPRFPLTRDKNNRVTQWIYPLRELRKWQEQRLLEAGYKPETKAAPTKRRRAMKGEGAAA